MLRTIIIGFGLSLILFTHGICATLKWDKNTDSTTGYKIYYSTMNNEYKDFVDAGNVSEYSIDALPLSEGQMYYIVVTAYNDKSESGYSAVNVYTLGDSTPPLPPTGLTVE